MEIYDRISLETNKLITTRYSTSFGLSSTLFPKQMRAHIYSIYGLVRVADEIVDTYRGANALELLDGLETDCVRCIDTGYSANPVVHSYGITARQFGIEKEVIAAFFNSMRMDLSDYENTPANYALYIYGSAEAVGLMCLSVFVNDDKKQYGELSNGARALGAAYQKINFLRDLASDKTELGRWYFPDSSYEMFDDTAKKTIVEDINKDITAARAALAQLPDSSKRATALSLDYYDRLLRKLNVTSAAELKRKRIRIADSTKLLLYIRAKVLPV